MALLSKKDVVEPKEVNNVSVDDIQVSQVLSMSYGMDVNDKDLYESMLANPLIATAINLIVTDALQPNALTERTIWVDPDNKASESVVDDINAFLKEIGIEEMLPYIGKMILAYGQVGVEQGVQTKYEDDMTEPKITETENDYNKFSAILEDEEQIKITADAVSDEGELNFEIPYRWYIQPLGTNYLDIKYKGKRMFLYNCDTNKIFTSDLLVMFKAAELEYKFFTNTEFAEDGTQIDKTFTIEKGRSYLDDAKLAFINYNAIQQAILLSRITRTQFYRIYEIEIGNQDAKSAEETMTTLKGKIQNKQTIDLTQNLLSKQNSVSLLTDIFTPIRNGQGSLTLKTIGGDFDPKQLLDLDNARNELIGALKVPHAYLGFVGEQPGGLTDSSITMQDTRYARTVRDLQKIIKFGVNKLIQNFLYISGYDLSDDFGYTICMENINTQEEAVKIKTQNDKLNNLTTVLDALEKMGVDLTNPDLRTALISKYIDADLNPIVSAAAEQEEEKPEQPLPDDGDNDVDVTVHAPAPPSGGSGLSRTTPPPSQEEIDNAPLGSLQGIDNVPDGLGSIEDQNNNGGE